MGKILNVFKEIFTKWLQMVKSGDIIFATVGVALCFLGNTITKSTKREG